MLLVSIDPIYKHRKLLT